ncbi:MAG: ATP-dependent zinc metalloprotease FtsH [bacterium]
MAEEKKSKPCWETGNIKDCGPRKIPSLFPPFNKKQVHFSLWYFIIALLVLHLLNTYIIRTPEKTVDFSEFKVRIKEGEIKRVQMGDKYYLGFPYDNEKLKNIEEKPVAERRQFAEIPIYKTVPVDDPSLVPLLDSLNIEYYARPIQENRLVDFFFNWILPFLFFLFIWRLIFKRMGKLGSNLMAFRENKAQLVAEGDTGTTFSDVAGADEAKEELIEIVDFLKQPEKYIAIGGKIPKGVLLVGPPGTGKTLLARAIAGEAKVPFFKMSGADFVEMFVGLGAARVRDLFKQAREKAPCIIFIDELDAIGKSRGPAIGGNDEREQTLNQLLVEMDGFDSRTGVIILAATNRPQVLDPALLRPGRFDRQILVDKPDLDGREAILKIHSKGVALDESVDLRVLAKVTAGFAGADLANIVNEAALLAVRSGRNKVNQKDFEEAIEKVIAGLEKKNRLINSKEREIVAYHETGHALVAAFTPGADPVQKITIVPRSLGALGYTMQLPTEDRFLMTKEELLGKINVLLGGRAAEEIIFSQISTGAANDLTKATDIAKSMITDYGMSEKFGNMILHAQKGPHYLGDIYPATAVREYSEATQQYIDEEIAAIINNEYKKVIYLLKSKIDILKRIASRLLEVEKVGAEEFLSLIKGA